MKKYLSVFLLIVFLISFSSCSNNITESSTDKISVVSTIFPYYDFTRNIAGNKADVKFLLTLGTEPHHFEPSPSDIVDIENCDIFIYNGGESDEWVENILESIENKDIVILKMMDYVNLLCVDENEHKDAHNNHNTSENDSINHEEHNHEHSHDEYDEHIWTSINNAQIISYTLANALCDIDSKNKDYYQTNLKNYCEQLEILNSEFNDIISNSKRNTVVFGDRFPLLYFANDYNIDYVSAFPGCSSETEPSISTLTHLIDYVRAENIPIVFHLDFSNGNTARLISEDSDAEIRLFYSCHNVTTEQFENGESYISLMKHNAKVLKEALS